MTLSTLPTIPLALLRLLALCAAMIVPPTALAAERDPDTHFFNAFLGDLREALGETRANGRRGLLVMYHFEECPACQRMRREVLNQPKVQDAFRSRFVNVAIDIRGGQTITDLNGKTYSESDYGRVMRIRGTPTFDFYALDGTHVYRHVGGLFQPEAFLALGEFVASGSNRTQTFDEYRRKLPAR